LTAAGWPAHAHAVHYDRTKDWDVQLAWTLAMVRIVSSGLPGLDLELCTG